MLNITWRQTNFALTRFKGAQIESNIGKLKKVFCIFQVFLNFSSFFDVKSDLAWVKNYVLTDKIIFCLLHV